MCIRGMERVEMTAKGVRLQQAQVAPGARPQTLILGMDFAQLMLEVGLHPVQGTTHPDCREAEGGN